MRRERCAAPTSGRRSALANARETQSPCHCRGSLSGASRTRIGDLLVIGVIRRTQSLTGRVGIVAGVLGLFRRDRVRAVGGYDGRMATKDMDLTRKLLLDGWQTAYEPRALVGMQVPTTLAALWAQRKRWARGRARRCCTDTRARSAASATTACGSSASSPWPR
jgi:hypothetical protein